MKPAPSASSLSGRRAPGRRVLERLRRAAIISQGLAGVQPYGRGLSGTLAAIEHLGYVQIDTLSVVERAHHHVLWTRVPDYEHAHLNELVRCGRIFEHWFHAAAYLPMRDYRFALPKMEAVRRGDARQFADADRRLMAEILARVRGGGPLRARDLPTSDGGRGEGVWSWGPGRRALETLFMQGDLMICERHGMTKVYDLAERLLPADIDLRVPDAHEMATHLLDATLRAHGAATEAQVLHLRTGRAIQQALRDVIDERMRQGALMPVDLPGMPRFVAEPSLLEVPARRFDGIVRVLSPFDNLVIHRARLKALFDFDYRLECYLPEATRTHGYFCLPILHRDRFIGRIDCKAHRRLRRFDVLKLHLEPPFGGGAIDGAAMAPEAASLRGGWGDALSDAIGRFASFNGCDDVVMAF